MTGREPRTWSVLFTDDALKDIKKLERSIGRNHTLKFIEKITRTLKYLDRNWHKIKPIKGLPGAYRLKVGTYRVAFRVDWSSKSVEVFFISSRESFYEKL